MKKGVESCGAQAAQAKEATSTGANVLEIPERGAQEPTPAWAEMGVADPTITFYDLRNLHEVRQDLGVDVEPVIDLEPRDDEGVTRPQRAIGEECNRVLVLPNEASWQLAGNDAAEDGRHEARLILRE